MTLPSLFLSHGAPTLPLVDTPARRFLSEFGRTLPRPKAILMISAHWDTDRPAVNAVAWNETIHDFYGFPRPLYELRYPAPGSPDLAATVVGHLRTAGLPCDVDQHRGLDHGAWVPLLLMFPAADIPVVQLSVQPHLGPDHHLKVGRALSSLRDEGVLIIGSGSFTHNLHEFRGQDPNAAAPEWVNAFADWFDQALVEGRVDEILNYRKIAPYAVKNHPTDEHLLPVYAALGAGGEQATAERLHTSVTYSIIRMDVFGFRGKGETAIGDGASAKAAA